METILIWPKANIVEQCFEEFGFWGDFCRYIYSDITTAGRFYTDVSMLIDKEGMRIPIELNQALKCLSYQLGLTQEYEKDSLALIIQIIRSTIAYRKENQVVENAIELKNHVEHLKSLKNFLKEAKPYKDNKSVELVPIAIRSYNIEVPHELVNRLLAEIKKYKNENHAKYQTYIRWNDQKWDTVYANYKNAEQLNIRYQKQSIVNLLKYIKHVEPVLDYANEELTTITPGKVDKLIARVFQLSGLRPRFTPEEEASLCSDEVIKRKDKPFEVHLEKRISTLKNRVIKDLNAIKEEVELKGQKKEKV